MLAGFAVSAAIVLAVVVVVLFGGGSGSGNGGNGGGDNSSIIVDPLTPQASVVVNGFATKAIAAASVRTGPGSGTEYSDISPLRNGQDVIIMGHATLDSSWFQIDLGGSLRGWIPASSVKVPEENIRTLPIAVNTPVHQPTAAPTQPPVPTATAGRPRRRRPSPRRSLPGRHGRDNRLSSACTPGTPVVLVVRNSGGGILTGRSVGVTLSNAQGVIFNGNMPLPDLAAGASATVATGQPASAPKMTARVSLFGTPADANPANDNAECAVAGPIPPTASSGGLITPTPRPPATVLPAPLASHTSTPRLPGT